MGIELPDSRCELCLKKSWLTTLRQLSVDEKTSEVFQLEMDEIVQLQSTEKAPELQRLIGKAFSRTTQISDPFLLRKRYSNQVAARLYDQWKPKVIHSADPFEMAVRLSVAANIIDYGVATDFDLEKTIQKVLHEEFTINDSHKLKSDISKSQNILYLGDNAGEIYFDKLFIEVIGHQNVTFTVRGGPSLNDALLTDATEAGIGQVARIISNGYDAPTTDISRSSDVFIDEFNKADLIISKGMGNLEGLMHLKDERIYFLLMAKCEVIASYLGVEKGSFVIAGNNRNESK